jgi:drug/metabolite transporter (DMT)-like permease
MSLNHNSNNNKAGSESFPLLFKRSDIDQSSNGTFLTCDLSTEESSSYGSWSSSVSSITDYHPDDVTDFKQYDNYVSNDEDEIDVDVDVDSDNNTDHHHHQDNYTTTTGNEEEESLLGLPLIEGVVEEFNDITEAVLEELHKADEDVNYMIEMGLTRNFSLLHDDVVEASGVLQSTEKLPDPPIDGGYDNIDDIELGNGTNKTETASSSSIPLSVYVLLLSAIVAMSTVGPLLQLQDDASSTMKVVWRMAGTSFLLFPFAIIDVYHYGIPKLTTPQWITFLISTLCYDVMSICFCLALDFTAVGNAVILSNSLALILLVGKLFTGAPTTMLELTGATIAFGGAILCSRDAANTNANATKNEGEGEDFMDDSHNNNSQFMLDGFGKTIVGDLLAITSAVGGVGYVMMAKTCRTHMSLYMFMFLTMSIGCLMVLFFQVFILQEIVTFDRDVTHGILGFLVWERSDRLPLELTMVVICNLLGTMGYVRAMPHFDSLVICSVQLLEPVIAEFLSYFSGVSALPGLVGWIGNIFVASGTFVVLYESQKSKDK